MPRLDRILSALALATLLTLAGCGGGPERMPLATALATQRFIAYVPRSFSIDGGRTHAATADGIADDLRRLRPHFSGLITYGLGDGQGQIVPLAAAAGYEAIAVGVWEPRDRAELDRAIGLARRYPRQVITLILGNEGLFWKRYTAADLRAAAAYVRERLPGVPLTTSEPFAHYFDSPDAAVLLELDLLMPNIHPMFEPWFDPANVEQSVAFVAEVVARLRGLTPKPILVKETGLPSAPAERGFDETRQAAFWRGLERALPAGATQNPAYFEAFDAPWKLQELAAQFGRIEPAEGHWGLFRRDGSPKQAVEGLPPLRD